MNDIFKSKRSLREVLPRDGRTRANNNDYDESPSLPPTRSYRREGRGRSWMFIVVVVVVLALFAGFALSKVFAQATVKVTPVQGRLLLNHTFEAKKTPTAEELGFVIVSSVSDVERKTLNAQGTEKVERKASGKITIYNNYSSTGQKLIANTRFESPDGKIFRIAEAITVPGYKKTGAETTPGSIEVSVTADKPGAEYNVGAVDFSIPGFKGDPRFGKIYAKSKAPMTGGFVGEMKKINETDKEKAVKEMEASLKERLIAEAKLEVPADFVLFSDATYITFEEAVNSASSSGGTAELSLTGKLHGLIFKKKDLAKYIAAQVVPNYDGGDVNIPNLDKLTFRLANKESLANAGLDRVSFSIEGNAAIVSSFNEAELIKRLTTTPDRNYEKVFAQYPTIDKAEISFRPPWLRTVPKDTGRVKIEIVLEGLN